MNDVERASVVKELARATSAQSQVANRYWIALITVSLVAALPRHQGNSISLPFGLGPIESSWFYPAMFGLLVILTLAFASAHAQLIRVQRLAHRAMDQLGDEPVLGGKLHPRDFFDALRVPSVVRLAPLAQLLRSRDSFFGSPGIVSPWRKWVSAAYYVLLKIASWMVYFGFPGAALWLIFSRTGASGWLWWGLLASASIASFSIAQLVVLAMGGLFEVRYTIVDLKPPPNIVLQPTAVDTSVSRPG